MRIVQITDTHIMKEGELLYGTTDTAKHLRAVIAEVNSADPKIDCVLITGDLVEQPNEEAFHHFKKIISGIKPTSFLLPGNHDNPEMMAKVFEGGQEFPPLEEPFQYTLEDFEVRILMLNSHQAGSDLPAFGKDRLAWLEQTLATSKKPVLIAIHHPPMETGMSMVDMVGPEWYQGLDHLIAKSPEVKLVICGHAHSTLTGTLGGVPVYMASSSAYQLAVPRGLDRAPFFISMPASAVLHEWNGDHFRSGPQAWPAGSDEKRIDALSGMDWDSLKKSMRGEK